MLEEPRLKEKRRRLAERALRWVPPLKRETVTGIRSPTGRTVEGDMILWPMIPEQIVKMPAEFTVGRLIEAGKLAQRLGAKIVGLGAYAAWVGRRGVLLAEIMSIPVTTGTSYTIAVALEALRRAAAAVGIELSGSTVTVIGATGCIGEICCRLLSRETGRLILTARHEGKLRELTGSIRALVPEREISFTTNVREAVVEADVVFVCTNVLTPFVALRDVKPGSLVCDISLPHNIRKEEAENRPDVLVIDGGVVRPPGQVDFHFHFGLGRGLVYACMAETMILALEELYVSFSLGGDISLANVVKVEELGKKHGFTVAEFISFGNPVPQERLEQVRQARRTKQPRRSTCLCIPSPLSQVPFSRL